MLQSTRKLIIVAGMHRSGTSTFTGAIEGLGVYLGGKLATGQQNINEKGYKEDVAVVDFHENLLWSYPSSWDDIFPLNPSKLSHHNIQDAKNKIREILASYFDKHQYCGLKDPRICLFLPIWIEVCQEENINLFFIIPFRNPYAVAKSLNTRDGILTERSLVLWTKYLLEAEKHSRGFPRIILSYEKLLSDPASIISIIFEKLEIPSHKNQADQIIRAANFINTKLNRSGNAPMPEEIAFTFPSKLYNLFLEIDGRNTTQEEQQKLNNIYQSYLSLFDQLTPILVDQINSYKTHAAVFRSYWHDALNSKAIKLYRILKKFIGND